MALLISHFFVLLKEAQLVTVLLYMWPIYRWHNQDLVKLAMILFKYLFDIHNLKLFELLKPILMPFNDGYYY